jgi:hypothetical protein
VKEDTHMGRFGGCGPLSQSYKSAMFKHVCYDHSIEHVEIGGEPRPLAVALREEVRANGRDGLFDAADSGLVPLFGEAVSNG